MKNIPKIITTGLLVILFGCRVQQPIPKASPEQQIAVLKYFSGEWDMQELTAELVYLKETK